ncbi:MAG TPA: ABC transporter permease [Puia sp.]|nr:ABC transporter permease [Puia sp.]
MLQNYLKVAWRNLRKHKSFSLINILGLAIGIGACMIIFLYVQNELTYDLYNMKVDRIARVSTTLHTPESDVELATSPAPMADVLMKDFPEVESAVRMQNVDQVIKSGAEVFAESAFFEADQTIFSIFTFDFLEGSSNEALKNPRSIVLTETTSKKYFGNHPALGKILDCNGEPKTVTGVIKDRPANSDVHIDALFSTDFSKMTAWMADFDTYTYILFYKKPDLNKFQQKLIAVSKKYAQPELDEGGGAGKYKAEFKLQPLSDIHFSTEKLAETPKGNKQFIYMFSLLAVFILLIALLNYINLSTAKSTERAREVGIRKVSGASRFQLMAQFLFESFLLLTIACLLANGIVLAGLPFFNKLLQTNLSLGWEMGSLFTGTIFLVSLFFAGLYPAFILSAFKPIKVLKGNWRSGNHGIMVRKAITITQFAIAAALIMGTAVIYRQMNFIQKKDLGFNKDQLLNVWVPRDSAFIGSVLAFQNELRNRPEVQDLTVGDGLTIGGGSLGSTKLETEGKKRELMCIYYSVDPHFLSVFQIPLAEGRNLSDSFATDKKEAFLVNEAFVKTMGWKKAIGQSLEGMEHKGRVVGVVKNFYFKSLHSLIEPLILIYNSSRANTTSIKIKPRDLPLVKTLFKKNLPTVPINYSFYDEILNKQYLNDRMTMSLFNAFTVLAIFVSCLGLYGLVALIAAQRTKEIGIRKVLGASLKQLFSLMTKDFIRLVCLGLLIALPVSAMVMNKWLTSYAYHIQISWWMFLIPALLVLLIAMAVISREIIKTALANPVKSLRSE